MDFNPTMDKSAAELIDRRPIATRNRKWAQAATGWLAARNVTLGYIATIIAIYTAYVRAAGKIAGAANEFCGPMAKQHRMLVITLICLYSAIAPRSWQMITFNDSQIGLMTLGLVVMIVGCV